jgi:hypothetical protein
MILINFIFYVTARTKCLYDVRIFMIVSDIFQLYVKYKLNYTDRY